MSHSPQKKTTRSLPTSFQMLVRRYLKYISRNPGLRRCFIFLFWTGLIFGLLAFLFSVLKAQGYQICLQTWKSTLEMQTFKIPHFLTCAVQRLDGAKARHCRGKPSNWSVVWLLADWSSKGLCEAHASWNSTWSNFGRAASDRNVQSRAFGVVQLLG